MGCAKTIAIGHRWVHGLLHCDFDVRCGSGGNRSDSAICGSPRWERQVGAGCGRYGFSGRARTDHDCGFDRQAARGNAADSHRQQSENLLGRDSNRPDTGRTGFARGAGNYTRYGDVFDLLRASDDRFVVFGSGEGLKLDFDPKQLTALPTGWVRDYFFYADGFEKDLDFYAAHAFTVEPLPRHSLLPYPYPEGRDYPADAEHLGYQLEYNTRSRSERMPPSLRYQYSSRH